MCKPIACRLCHIMAYIINMAYTTYLAQTASASWCSSSRCCKQAAKAKEMTFGRRRQLTSGRQRVQTYSKAPAGRHTCYGKPAPVVVRVYPAGVDIHIQPVVSLLPAGTAIRAQQRAAHLHSSHYVGCCAAIAAAIYNWERSEQQAARPTMVLDSIMMQCTARWPRSAALQHRSDSR